LLLFIEQSDAFPKNLLREGFLTEAKIALVGGSRNRL